MSDPQDFGRAAHARADALGEPGHRTFRLRLSGERGAALLWLEKEQLQALGMAIEQLLAQLRSNKIGQVQPAEPLSETGDFPGRWDLEIRVGRLGLGYDDDQDMLVLIAHDQDADPDGPATLTCRLSRGRVRALASEISTVVAAGRPRCPLCNQALGDGPHACPGSNGKTHHPISGPGVR